MDIVPIRNEADYYRALRRVEELWSAGKGSAERQELLALAAFIVAYGRKYYRSGSGGRGRKPIKLRLLEELRESLQGALVFEPGGAVELPLTHLPPAPAEMGPRVREIASPGRMAKGVLAESCFGSRTEPTPVANAPETCTVLQIFRKPAEGKPQPVRHPRLKRDWQARFGYR